MSTAYIGNYLATLGNVIPFALLPTIIVARLSATDNAYFYVTWLLGGAFFMVSSAVGSALFAEGSNDPERIDTETRSAVKITALMLAPMMLLFFVAGHWLLAVFGARYSSHGTTLLFVLTASAIPDAITNIYNARLRALEQLAFPAAMNMGMAAITLLGAWLLLPPLGILGAGVAWIAAQTAGTVAVIVHVAVTRRRARRRAPAQSATTRPSTATTASPAAGAHGEASVLRSRR
jgi:O-antigen/teichoic acid export membrane protein